MADVPSKNGGQDLNRIDIHQERELREWSKKFGVSPEQLKAAVRKVGHHAEAVEIHLHPERYL